MREKELRFALVCFGGISLAIYIHGVTKEILKLARASKAFHFSPDPNADSKQRYIYPNEDVTDLTDTEPVYFDILKSFAPDLELRVVIDTIAGASAGGMNSIFLGRALAHDLNMDHLRDHWLHEADVSRLVGEKKPPGRLDKLFTKPLINMFSNRFLADVQLKEKVRQKLPALLNIWSLKPPFDGKHLLGLIYRGLDRMGDGSRHSLLPRGHQLDLFVTLTDYHGFQRYIPINDPPIIEEREHRHRLKFSYFKGLFTSVPEDSFSDFEKKDLPALSFASRATACYPGAFPPAQLREVDHFLKDLGQTWTEKDNFLKANFDDYRQAGLDPHKTSFLDGSILNNKPFDQVIDAIHGRPAFRKVDRRIVYIDPNPEQLSIKLSGAPPSLLNTIKGALSDIPMNQPMHDDLMEVQALNQQVRIIKTVVDSIKPNVEALVKEISASDMNGEVTADDIRSWRNLANARSVKDAGFSYEGYARLKVRNCLARLTRIIGDICDCPSGSEQRRHVFSILQCWAYQDEVIFSGLYGHLLREASTSSKLLDWVSELFDRHKGETDLPAWAQFLVSFDVSYHKRRLQFMIQELNKLYGEHDLNVQALDQLKGDFYKVLQHIEKLDDSSFVSDPTRNVIKETFCALLQQPFDDNPTSEMNICSLATGKKGLSVALDMLAQDLSLDKYRAMTDNLIAEQNNMPWQETVGHELTVSYLGFAFWDVITFSVMGARDLGEFNEILVNRISPNDGSVLKKDQKEMPLRGTAMRSFGAFFSRADRENDYLWGRLNGAERLIDILANQAALEHLDNRIDVKALKKRAFLAILETEKEHLSEVPELFEELKARIEAL